MKTKYIWLVTIICLGLCSIVPSATREIGADSIINSYSFRVEINGVDAGNFERVEGLSITQDVIEYQDEDSSVIRKKPGSIRYGDIILRKGYTAGSVLNNWIELARVDKSPGVYRKVSIILESNSEEGAVEIKRWNCYGCIPRFWKLSPLRSGGNNMLTEELVIAMEWFEEIQVFSY